VTARFDIARRVLAAGLALALVLPSAARGAAGGAEAELGRKFLLEARAQLPLVDDPAITEYVERIGRRIIKTIGPQPYDYHFYVVQHPALNAFAVPGGYVFVFAGLLVAIENDDELAGVLGHETGHVTGHHLVRQQTEGQVWSYAALLGALLSAVNPVLGASAIAAAQTAQLKYSREFEQEADYLGLRFTTEAGYDPHALGAFFKVLLAEQRVNPAGAPAYMLTHPLTENRISNVETSITAQKLRTPAGRPAASPELAEVQAVSRAMAEPTEAIIARYKKLADEKPEDAERQFLLGRVYQTVGQLEAARTALERARTLGGLGGRIDRPLGAVYVALKEPAKAREALSRHLARTPADGWAHLELGKAFVASGESDAALTEFQRALGLDGDLDEAHRLAGISLGQRGDQAEGFYHLAVASQLRGELEQALSQFERSDELLADSSPRKPEVEQAIEELKPLVRERSRDREHSGRRPHGLGPSQPLPNPDELGYGQGRRAR
jgi:predicted Zn-dependent protease